MISIQNKLFSYNHFVWFRLSLLVCVFNIFVGPTLGQANAKQNEYLQNETIDSCEESTLKISSVKAWFLKERLDDKSSIIIIAFSSSNERSSVANRRLKQALKGLATLGLDEKSIVLAEGLGRASLPRIDFYVNGRIVGRIITAHGKLFCIECCDGHGTWRR